MEAADRLEPQRLHAPRLERGIVVPWPVGMDMDAAAQLADMLVKGRLKPDVAQLASAEPLRSEEHTSELQSLMRISYAVFCLKKKKKNQTYEQITDQPHLYI